MDLDGDLGVEGFAAQHALVQDLGVRVVQMFVQFFGLGERLAAGGFALVLRSGHQVVPGDVLFVFLLVGQGGAALLTHERGRR